MPYMPRISVSVKAAIVREGQLLLLSYDDQAGFHYNLPGGKTREGESLRDAVRRKVMLETGLSVTADRLLFVVEYVPQHFDHEFGDVQKVQFNFLAHMLDPDAEPAMPNPPDADQVGFEWVPLHRLNEKYLLPRVTDQLVTCLTDTRPDALVDQW